MKEISTILARMELKRARLLALKAWLCACGGLAAAFIAVLVLAGPASASGSGPVGRAPQAQALTPASGSGPVGRAPQGLTRHG